MNLRQWWARAKARRLVPFIQQSNPYEKGSASYSAFEWEYIILPYYHIPEVRAQWQEQFQSTIEHWNRPHALELLMRIFDLRCEQQWNTQSQQNSRDAFADLIMHFESLQPLFEGLHAYVMDDTVLSVVHWDALIEMYSSHLDAHFEIFLNNAWIRQLSLQPTLAAACFWKVIQKELPFGQYILEDLWRKEFGPLTQHHPFLEQYTLWRCHPHLLTEPSEMDEVLHEEPTLYI